MFCLGHDGQCIIDLCLFILWVSKLYSYVFLVLFSCWGWVSFGSPNKMCLASSPSVKTRCMNNDVEMLLGSDHRAVVVSRCRAEFSLKLSRRAGLQCGCRRYQQSRAPAAAAIACIAWHVLLRCMHAMCAKVGAGAIDAYVGN